MGARLVVWISSLVVMLGSMSARAHAEEEVHVVELRFAERGGALVVEHLGMGALLFNEDAYRKLAENPLATVVVVRLYVYEKGRSQPVSYRLMTLRIVYDLWMEEYEVRVDSERGRSSGRFARLAQAYKAITELERLPVALLDDIAIGPHYYLGLVAELNPVSSETMAEVRRWLTRPAGATRLDRDTSFFGSFVSIFVNARLPEAERVIRVRSQPFYRVPR